MTASAGVHHWYRLFFISFMFLFWLTGPEEPAWAANETQEAEGTSTTEKRYEVPNRYGVAVSFAQGYGLPENWGTALVTLIGLFDYDRVWPHRAPDPLRFKVELTAGTTTWPDVRAVVSANILALYYLEWLSTPGMRPYIEGGIGGIYTDYQVKGQGSRVNFNPVAGLGLEFPRAFGPTIFTALRASHASNAGLCKDNTGVDSLGLMLGMYF